MSNTVDFVERFSQLIYGYFIGLVKFSFIKIKAEIIVNSYNQAYCGVIGIVNLNDGTNSIDCLNIFLNKYKLIVDASWNLCYYNLKIWCRIRRKVYEIYRYCKKGR
jgi:hypothetical protein